jgi:hypothetical protein
MHRAGRCFVGELRDGLRDPAPDSLTLESGFLQRRVLCEPEAGAVMVGNFFQQLRNEGL